MKKLLQIALALCLVSFTAFAQEEYVPTPVTISREKTRNAAGETFYSHVVLERQTLFSIAKAYEVSIEAIYEANQALNLESEGLKKNQIILIPIAQQEKDPEYIVHTVKWFEDLDGIASKYGVPVDVIKQINGLKSSTLSRRQKLNIPANYTGSEDYTDATREDADSRDGSDRLSEGIMALEDLINFRGKGKGAANAALILPLDANGSAAENPYDFYCGALMAIRDLEAEGLNIKLDVFDCAHGAMPASSDDLQNTDVIIGPIAIADITRALDNCPKGSYIVSPLEPKASSLAASHSNVIQLPSNSDRQATELIRWLAEEKKTTDKIIFVTEKGVALSGNSAVLKASLDSLQASYSTISYGILEGRNIISQFEKHSSSEGTTRIVVASENEAFVNDVIRNITLLNVRKYEAIAYCLAKVHNFDTIDVAQFHNTRMHICAQYYVNYSSEKVNAFLLSYRALFNSEPSPFSYQGYDSTYQMIKACCEGSRDWTDNLTDSRKIGLQTDFEFVRSSSGSLVNTATRRVLYDEGYRIRLVDSK